MEILAELESLRRRVGELEHARETATAVESDDHRWFVELNPQVPWTASPDGQILDFNQRWLDLTGLSREEALGEGWTRVPHPEDLPAMQQAWAEALETCRPYDVEHRIRLADGSFRWMRSRAFPRKDVDGRVIRWYGATEDIHDGKEARNALVRSERIYRAIGETIPFGIWICEPGGRNIYASEALLSLIGMTQEECRDFGWERALAEEDRERVMSAWKDCVRVQGDWDQEFRYRGTDGKLYPVLVRGVPVSDDKGELLCWAGVNLDIRRVKESQGILRKQTEELRAANGQLEQFAYAAAHDLQEPLRTMKIYTQLLLRAGDTQPEEQKRSHGKTIQEAAARMDRLIQALLRFSQVQTEPGSIQPVKAVETLGEAMNVCRLMIEQTNAQIEYGALPTVIADPLQLSLLFQNLLSNAIKYSKRNEPPKIEIRAEQQNDEWMFVVRDRGIGFPPEYADRIFMPFKRLHSQEEYQGTGLGLAICKRIVERFEGRMWAESEVDKGSAFYFTLKPGDSRIPSIAD